MTAFHYYGSSVYGWEVADTPQEVARRLSYHLSTDALARARKEGRGLSAVICRVELPISAHYSISNFMPHIITTPEDSRKGEPVPMTNIEPVYIITRTGKYKHREV